MTPRTLAQSIPARWRTVIYSVLATAYGFELVLDLIPPGVEGKILGVLAVLGFGVAALNVTPPAPPATPENYPGEFA